MTTIYFLSICDDDVGEVEGMFDANGDVLGTWCNNDARWRGEYFEPFLEALGIRVLDVADYPSWPASRIFWFAGYDASKRLKLRRARSPRRFTFTTRWIVRWRAPFASSRARSNRSMTW